MQISDHTSQRLSSIHFDGLRILKWTIQQCNDVFDVVGADIII